MERKRVARLDLPERVYFHRGADDAAAAQKLLAHKSVKMTESYIKQRQTDEVAPLTRRKKHGP